MSLTVSQGEDETVFPVTLNPKSKWHIWLQILGALWDCIVWSVSQDIKENESDIQPTFRILLFAVINFTLAGFGFAAILFVTFWLARLVTFIGLDASIVMSVLQYCVVFCFLVLTLKSLRKKSVSVKSVEDTTEEVATEGGLCQRLVTFIVSRIRGFTVCEDIKETFTDTHTALGIVQIIAGVVNIAFCCFGLAGSYYWFCSVSLLVGIVCVVAVKHPSSGLLIVAVILSIVNAALAITAVVLHLLDLKMRESPDSCYYYFGYSMLSQEEISNINTCEYYNNLNTVFLGGVHIIMTVLSGLQFCVTFSFCVLTLKAMCKNYGGAKSEEKPQAVVHAAEIGIVV